MEYCPYGQIFDFVAQAGWFSEKIALYYFKQLITGLIHLHENNYSHRDLKLENILIGDDFMLKIADFGFATSDNTNASHKGT